MKHDADWKIIATLGFLVATVAIPTVASLVAPEERTTLTPAKREVPTELGREPASVSADSNSHVISFDIRCTKVSAQKFAAEGSYVQIKGRDCGKTALKKPMTVTNTTNGFQASIFDLGKSEFQTDLIQLKAGENQISVQFETESGTSEEAILKIHADRI